MQEAHSSQSPTAARRNVLFLVHDALDAPIVGGTRAHVQDLVRVLGSEFRCYVAFVRAGYLFVDEFTYAGDHLERRDSLMFRLQPQHYASTLGKVLGSLRISVVHVHHMLGHDRPGVAAALERFNGLKVRTVHDYFPTCPRINLLYKGERYCGLPRDPGVCAECMGWTANALAQHRAEQKAVFEQADQIVFPSFSISDSLSGICELAPEKTAVIEHGLAFEPRADLKPAEYGGGTLRVAYIGSLLAHKGIDTLKRAFLENTCPDIEWHVWGAPRFECPEPLAGKVVWHGAYKRSQIAEQMTAEGIHLGLLPAIWPETFSYALSEFYAVRVPVLGTTLGAIGDRIRRNRTGWTFEPGDVDALLATVTRLHADPSQLRTMRESGDFSVQSLTTMGARYRELYATTPVVEPAGSSSARLNQARLLAKVARDGVIQFDQLCSFMRRYGLRRTANTAYDILKLRLQESLQRQARTTAR